MARRRMGILLMCCAYCTACGRSDIPSNVVVLDSMGILLVESVQPAWTEVTAAWSVEAVPRLRIGVLEGSEDYQFFGLRDAVVVDDGTIIATNDGSSELRFFDRSGVFLGSAGRRGEGPGEFGEFSRLRLCMDGERILVPDGAHNRVNVFARSGQYISTFRLQPVGSGNSIGIFGCAGAGALLGVFQPGGGLLDGAPGDVLELANHYVLVDYDGSPTSTVAQLRTRPRFVNEVEGVIHYPYIPLTPQHLIVASPDAVYISASGAAAVEKRTHAGEVVAIFRWRAPSRQSVTRVWADYVRESLDAISNEVQRKRYARLYAKDLPLPDSTPALQALHLDPEGNLWAQRYRLPGGADRLWDVITAEGTWLGAVTMPDALEVLRIGANVVVGRERDELGVERLVVYELVKP